MEIADYANSSSPTETLGDIHDFTAEKSHGKPIDEYIKSTRSLLAYGTPERLREASFVGRLLALGLVAEAENYIRFTLAHTIEICPRSQAACSTQQINLGGYCGMGNRPLGEAHLNICHFLLVRI